jgi:hypothetical protein
MTNYDRKFLEWAQGTGRIVMIDLSGTSGLLPLFDYNVALLVVSNQVTIS